MRTALEYRAMAEECFRWAREASDEAVRTSYLQMAQVWLDAAYKLDGLPATRLAATPDDSPKTAACLGRRTHSHCADLFLAIL
jgi:hypothetical protein